MLRCVCQRTRTFLLNVTARFGADMEDDDDNDDEEDDGDAVDVPVIIEDEGRNILLGMCRFTCVCVCVCARVCV